MDGRVALFSEDNRVFNKCGEILFTTDDEGERIYSFSCISCDDLFTQIDDFVTHLQHSDDYLVNTKTDAVENKEDFIEFLRSDFMLTTKEIKTVREEENQEEEFIELPRSNFLLTTKEKETVKEEDDQEEELPPSGNQIRNDVNIIELEDSEDELLHEDAEEDIVQIININNKPTQIDDAICNEESAVGGYMDDDHYDIYVDIDNGSAEAAEDTSEYEDNSDSELKEDKDGVASAARKVLKLAIISAYENHPVLWKRVESYNNRDLVFAKIAKSISHKLAPLHLSANDVRVMIEKITLNYRKEKQKLKLAKLNGKEYNPPWYFDKLKFLDCDKGSVKKNEVEKPTRKHVGFPLSNLTDEQHLQLFKIYKNFPSLWNLHDGGFHIRDVRNKALEEMTHIVNEKIGLNYSPYKLKMELDEIIYECSICKHLKWECERLKKPFEATSKYYEQIAFLEPHVQPFKCPYCDEVLRSKQKFIKHKSKHDGSLPYKCAICKREFKQAGSCALHMRRHTQELPFSCKECGKNFTLFRKLTKHMQYHKGKGLSVCEICGRSFSTPTNLEYHIRRHLNDRSFKCSVCDKAFYDNYRLNQHMERHLNVVLPNISTRSRKKNTTSTSLDIPR